MDSPLATRELLGKAGRHSTGLDIEQMAGRVARSHLHVLIRGETGTGKTWLAKRIHAESSRAGGPLLILTCAGLGAPATERALFGGARSGGSERPGKGSEGMLLAADGGTLVLDDVAALRPAAQASLLRFLETGVVERAGSRGRLLDVRIISTTHQNLQAAVAAGTFRADLLFRLDGVGFTLPPLRERQDDIPVLAGRFLDELGSRLPSPTPSIAATAITALQRHGWPGNLRELRHVIERAACVSSGGVIEPGDLLLPAPTASPTRNTPSSVSTPTRSQQAGGDHRSAAEAHGAALAPGDLLGATYRILRLIGSGSTGQVYEATHERLEGRFAVKVLHPRRAGDPRRVARFVREAQIASRLQHANIAGIVDFDRTDSGIPYLVMELVDGCELSRVIADGAPLPLGRVLGIVDQIASAFSLIHEREIVHRDLKPQNILLVPAQPPNPEQVKLVDFGISKLHLPCAELTGESAVLGTPQYMAPEQALGTDQVGARADQFALAAVVWEMLTGRKAFRGDCVANVLYRIIYEDPEPFGNAAGPAVEAVLRQALAKDAARRFPSILEFASQLRLAASVSDPRPAPTELGGSPKVDLSLPGRAPFGRRRRHSPLPSRTLASGARQRTLGQRPHPGLRR